MMELREQTGSRKCGDDKAVSTLGDEGENRDISMGKGLKMLKERE